LENKSLETAASYLIIIQNLEKSEISQQVSARPIDCSIRTDGAFLSQFAQVLLEHALESARWELAADILRFIRSIGRSAVRDQNTHTHTHPLSLSLYSIDPQDLNSDEYIRTITGRFPATTSNRVSSSLTSKSPLSSHRDALTFSYVTSIRQRTASVANPGGNASTNTIMANNPETAVASGNPSKGKTSWPSTTNVPTNNPSNVSPTSNADASSTVATTEARRRKLSSSAENRSPRKDIDSQHTSFEQSDSSVSSSPTIVPSTIPFIQRTLNQHALNALAKGRLRHLGYMAANIADFDLSQWLRMHK
jgi:hypothetical protein